MASHTFLVYNIHMKQFFDKSYWNKQIKYDDWYLKLDDEFDNLLKNFYETK